MHRLLVLAVLALAGCDVPPITPDAHLNASVTFDGKGFVVTNDGPDQWFDITFTLNDDFELREHDLNPKQTYTTGALFFAKSDGTRFNPYLMKPLRMRIVAYVDSPNGRQIGTYAGTFGQ